MSSRSLMNSSGGRSKSWRSFRLQRARSSSFSTSSLSTLSASIGEDDSFPFDATLKCPRPSLVDRKTKSLNDLPNSRSRSSRSLRTNGLEKKLSFRNNGLQKKLSLSKTFSKSRLMKLASYRSKSAPALVTISEESNEELPSKSSRPWWHKSITDVSKNIILQLLHEIQVIIQSYPQTKALLITAAWLIFCKTRHIAILPVISCLIVAEFLKLSLIWATWILSHRQIATIRDTYHYWMRHVRRETYKTVHQGGAVRRRVEMYTLAYQRTMAKHYYNYANRYIDRCSERHKKMRNKSTAEFLQLLEQGKKFSEDVKVLGEEGLHFVDVVVKKAAMPPMA